MDLSTPYAAGGDATSRSMRPTPAPLPLQAVADQASYYRWRDQHDIFAAHEVARSYRWLVVELANSYRDSGLPWDDLVAEGSVGLMRAICRFDPDRGVGFPTYATWWVNATLQEYVRTGGTADNLEACAASLRRAS